MVMTLLSDLHAKIVQHALKCDDFGFRILHDPSSLGRFVECKCGKRWEIDFAAVLMGEKDGIHFKAFESMLDYMNSDKYKEEKKIAMKAKMEKEEQEKRSKIMRDSILSLEI